jgi:acetyltransferase-like isoleucine patch superfamily enzyme
MRSRFEYYLKKILIIIKIINLKIKYNNKLKIGFTISVGLHFDLSIINSNSKIFIGEKVQFRDYCKIRCEKNGIISIGDSTFFNNNLSINALGKINIGDNCQFGESVKLYDHNHRFDNNLLDINQQGYSTGFIKIGNNCWIGSNVIILKDVEIGDNVVIGAGCVIHKSIRSNSVVHIDQDLKIKNRKSD